MTNEPISMFGPRLSETATSNIRAEAARVGVTQTDIARALGISQSAISARWNGKTEWSLDDIDTVAILLNLDPLDLLRQAKKSARRVANAPSSLYTAWDSNPEPSDSGFSQLISLNKVTDLLAYKVRKAV